MSWRSLLNTWLEISVHSKDMVGNPAIPFFFNVVCHDKEKIETGEEGVWERNVFVRVLVNIVLEKTLFGRME